MAASLHSMPWDRLLDEFAFHSPEGDEVVFQCDAFVHSLAVPSPPFVDFLLGARLGKGSPYGAAVRDLYFFLLKKRYEERLNLLHFAFDIFDDSSRLPKEVIDRTPFPHEEGLPRFGDPTVLACLPQETSEG